MPRFNNPPPWTAPRASSREIVPLARPLVHSRPPAVPVASPAATSPAATHAGHHVQGLRRGRSSSAFGLARIIFSEPPAGNN